MSQVIPGATAVGIKASNGIVLAADKRVTYGFWLMSKSGKKVFRIADKLGIASAGLMADMQTLSRMLEAELRLYELESGTRAKVWNAAKLLSLILYNRRLFPYFVEMIIGGIDEEGPHVYSIDPIGAIIEEKYIALGSGAPLAISIIESSYNDNITVEKARELAIKSVEAAFKRDAISGDGIDILIITDSETREEFIPVTS